MYVVFVFPLRSSSEFEFCFFFRYCQSTTFVTTLRRLPATTMSNSNEKRSYEEVNGPVPSGPVVDPKTGLAQQVVGSTRARSTASKPKQRSYQEVNGPMPSGPVIDDAGLACQVVGSAPIALTPTPTDLLFRENEQTK